MGYVDLHDTVLDTDRGRARLITQVAFEHDKLPPSTVTFSVDEPWVDWVEPSPAALLPSALVLAARLGDDLRTDHPIDPATRAACLDAVALQSRWWGWRTPELVAPTAPPRRRGRAPGRGLFFTRGVDSWGSFLTLAEASRRRRPTHLVTVDGDVHLPAEVRSSILAATAASADRLGLPLVVVSTDLRTTIDPHSEWGRHTHGGALAGVGHLLRRGLGEVTIGATNWWPDATPNGSHPDLDRRWSTPGLRIIHDGADEPRWSRIRRIGTHPEVRASLLVCWEDGAADNCGRCFKCLHTMTNLHLAGADWVAERFAVPYDPLAVAALPPSQPHQVLGVLDHCDRVGLAADPVRQHWEQVTTTADARSTHRPLATARRVPVRAEDGHLSAAATLALGRALAGLGLRVDHRPPVGDDHPSLTVAERDGDVLVRSPDGVLRPIGGRRRSVALEPALAAIGFRPDPSAAFDPAGQPPGVDGWEARRRHDAWGAHPTDHRSARRSRLLPRGRGR